MNAFFYIILFQHYGHVSANLSSLPFIKHIAPGFIFTREQCLDPCGLEAQCGLNSPGM